MERRVVLLAFVGSLLAGVLVLVATNASADEPKSPGVVCWTKEDGLRGTAENIEVWGNKQLAAGRTHITDLYGFPCAW